MQVIIEVVDHREQRYPTAGDWELDEKLDRMHIKVSRLENFRHEFLVALHELVEAVLCRYQGISQEDVTEFDKHNPELDEPGDSPRAPYHKQHVQAGVIERMMAEFLNVDWLRYEDDLDSLGKEV